MKRILRFALVLSVALVLLLTACNTGGSDTTTVPPTDDPTTVAPTTPPTEAPTTPSTNPTPATYTVSFTGNGVSIKAQTVKAGGYATKPTDPFWDGGVFVEWQLNGEAFDFENTPITADITLTASYTLNEYTIRFFDENDQPIGDAQILHYGDKATVPDYAPAGDKEFVDWRNKARTSIKDPTAAVTANESYYAYCLATYKVTFKLEDGTVVADNLKVADGLCAIPPVYVKGTGDDAVSYVFVPKTADEWKVTGDVTFTLTEEHTFRQDALVFQNLAANGNAVTNGTVNNAAYILMGSAGVYAEVTTDVYAAGIFSAYIAMVENTPADYSVTIEVEVDGVVVNRFSRKTGDKGYITLAMLTKGQHTVKWTVTETHGEKGDGWLGLLCSAYNYSKDLTGVEFSTVFKDADGEILSTVNSGYGTPITPPDVPATLPDGRSFDGWFNEQGIALDGHKVTDNSTWQARYSLSHTVTYKDAEGNVIGTVRVPDGQTAPLPTSDAFYYAVAVSELVNITADKEIVLTAVAKSAYSKDGKANQTEQGLNSNMTADVAEKYQYSTDGSAKPYGTVFHKVGQKLTFTADFAGDLSMYFNVDKTARRFVLDITVDGAAYATVILDTTEKTIGSWSVLCNLPAGVHTVTVTVTEASGDGLAAWSGLNITSLRIISKAE